MLPRYLEDGLFSGRRPDLVHPPSGFRVWLISPVGMLTQVGEQKTADEEVARFLSETASDALEKQRRPGERAIYLHDWRTLAGYSPGARKIMTDWALRVRTSAERIVIALSPDAKVVRMGVGVATMALQVAGFSVDAVDDLEPVLRELRVRPR